MTTGQRPAPATRLDRIVTIEKPTVARDRFGSELLTWTLLAEVWAEKRRGSRPSSERFINDANREQSLRRATFRIRQRRDVYEVYRLVDDSGLTWDIEGVSHFGREWTDLICAVDVSALR